MQETGDSGLSSTGIDTIITRLRESELLEDVEDWVVRLFASHGTNQVLHFARGDWLLTQGAPRAGRPAWTMMLSGIGHVLRQVNEEGRPSSDDRRAGTRPRYRHVAFRYPPQQSGALTSLAGTAPEVSVLCLTDCTCLRVDTEDLRVALKVSDRLARNFYTDWARRFSQYAQRAEWGKYLTDHETVAAFLFEAGVALKANAQGPPYLQMRQEDIAEYVGISYDNLRTSILKDFKRQKLVMTSPSDGAAQQRGKLYIPDPDAIVRRYPRCVPDSLGPST